jgi:hypothetical protein
VAAMSSHNDRQLIDMIKSTHASMFEFADSAVMVAMDRGVLPTGMMRLLRLCAAGSLVWR